MFCDGVAWMVFDSDEPIVRFLLLATWWFLSCEKVGTCTVCM